MASRLPRISSSRHRRACQPTPVSRRSATTGRPTHVLHVVHHEYDVTFNDKAGTSTWTGVNVGPPTAATPQASTRSGYTDSTTGRTFVKPTAVPVQRRCLHRQRLPEHQPMKVAAAASTASTTRRSAAARTQGTSGLTATRTPFTTARRHRHLCWATPRARGATTAASRSHPMPVWTARARSARTRAGRAGWHCLPADGNCHGQVRRRRFTDAGKTWDDSQGPGRSTPRATVVSAVPMAPCTRVGRRHRSPMVAISQNRARLEGRQHRDGKQRTQTPSSPRLVIAGDGNRGVRLPRHLDTGLGRRRTRSERARTARSSSVDLAHVRLDDVRPRCTLEQR